MADSFEQAASPAVLWRLSSMLPLRSTLIVLGLAAQLASHAADKVSELEATRFSTTTKLSGQATFVVGANAFSVSAVNTAANTVTRAPNEFTGRPRTPVPLPNATTFN